MNTHHPKAILWLCSMHACSVYIGLIVCANLELSQLDSRSRDRLVLVAWVVYSVSRVYIYCVLPGCITRLPCFSTEFQDVETRHDFPLFRIGHHI